MGGKLSAPGALSGDADVSRAFLTRADGGPGAPSAPKAREAQPVSPVKDTVKRKESQLLLGATSERWLHRMGMNSPLLEMQLILLPKKIKLFHHELVAIYTF